MQFGAVLACQLIIVLIVVYSVYRVHKADQALTDQVQTHQIQKLEVGLK